MEDVCAHLGGCFLLTPFLRWHRSKRVGRKTAGKSGGSLRGSGWCLQDSTYLLELRTFATGARTSSRAMTLWLISSRLLRRSSLLVDVVIPGLGLLTSFPWRGH